MALEKPYILPTRALPNQAPVNFNHFSTFVKQDVSKIGNRASQNTSAASEIEYNIVWEPNPNSQSGQSLIWRYPDQKCRDLDYSELINKISVPLGPNN